MEKLNTHSYQKVREEYNKPRIAGNTLLQRNPECDFLHETSKCWQLLKILNLVPRQQNIGTGQILSQDFSECDLGVQILYKLEKGASP